MDDALTTIQWYLKTYCPNGLSKEQMRDIAAKGSTTSNGCKKAVVRPEGIETAKLRMEDDGKTFDGIDCAVTVPHGTD